MTSPTNLLTATDDDHLPTLLAPTSTTTTPRAAVAVLNFHAAWAPQCAHMNEVFTDLARLHPSLDFVLVEAEELPDACDAYDVAAVPSFVVLHLGKPVERVNGANALELTNAVEKWAKTAGPRSSTTSSSTVPVSPSAGSEPATTATTATTLSPAAMEARLKQLINMAPMVLFMKGNPQQPRCGFSRQTVDLLAKYDARYSTFNILADEQVRQALKVYSNWPTFPQLYIHGDLIGGLDILKEMDATGELADLLPKEVDLNTRLGQLVKRSDLMIFIKGTPQQPRCGFSKQLVAILGDLKLTYDYFDILSDDDVRQGLKEFSNWPTFPQVYVKGELVGGLDIVKEMVESGDLASMLEGTTAVAH